MIEPSERQYWLWVARPDVYLDEDGNDREDLDPNSGVDSDGWWTCHKDTKKGDLVLLWRTSPKKDIGYLIQAESDAYSIADDNDHGWQYGCDYQVLYKFNHSINVKNLRNDPYFDEWGPLRCSFQRSSFRISLEYWNRLNQLAAENNPGYLDFIEGIQKVPLAEGIRLEEELEEELVNNLKILNKFGHDLNLYFDPTSNQSGRQLICKGNGGRIDLLCYDKNQNRYVVIELKNVRAGQNTFGQISNYMGWVQDRIAKGIPVSGLVISRGYDTRFESALKITDKISYINVDDLGFATAPSKKPQRFIEPMQNKDIKEVSKLGIRSAKSREAYNWLKKGNALFDQAKYDEAIACYDKVIEINPKNKWGWINKGDALTQLAKYDEAIKIYNKAIEIFPQSADVWCNKGFASGSLGKFDDAIVAFDKAIELKPKFADAWNGKGVVLDNMGKYDEAIQAYDKAKIIRPKFALAWSNKGVALVNQGKYDDAILAYDKAIEIDPNLVLVWNGKGVALYNLDKYDDAIQAYDKAIEIDPQDALTWTNKGVALNDLGKYDAAIKAYDEAIRLDPHNAGASAWYQKGKTLGQQGKHEAAIKAYDEVIKVSDKAIGLDPQNADAWNLKGEALCEQGKYNEAIKASDEAIRLDPGHEGAWYNKGLALYEQRKYDEAVITLDKAITIHPQYASAWNKKGEALKLLGRTVEADSAFTRAKELGYTG